MKKSIYFTMATTVLAMLTFTSCDKKEDGDRNPLFAELTGRMELVSGVAKDLKTGKETNLTGSEEFRLSLIFDNKNGYYLVNESYIPFKYTTNEDKYYATLDFGSGNETRLTFERKKGEANPVLTFVVDGTEVKGNFRNLGNLSEDQYKENLTGTWKLNAVKGWVYNEETNKKITVDQKIEDEDIVFEFLATGKGTVTVVDFDDEDGDGPEVIDVTWKVSQDVLLLDPVGSKVGIVMYIKNSTKDKLTLTSVDEEQYLDMTFNKNL